MSEVKTYNPKKNIVIFGGRQLTGFSDKDIISIKPNGDGIKRYVGADGEVGRALDPDDTYEIELSLAGTSSSNDYLSNCYNNDKKTGNGMKPLIIKDLGGSTMFFAKQAWVKKIADGKRGKEIDTNKWILNTGAIDAPVLGGND